MNTQPPNCVNDDFTSAQPTSLKAGAGYKIDFHTHSKLAKGLPFCPKYTNWHFDQALNAGLDAICITEHYNAAGINATFEHLQNNFTRVGDTFVTANGLAIFTGLEIDAEEGGHFLTIGAIEDIGNIYQNLEPFLQAKRHPKFNELVTIVKAYPVLYGPSHPFRDSNNVSHLSHNQMLEFDFLEINGKDTVTNPNNSELVCQLAKELGRPIIVGSDTHQSLQFGCAYATFHHKVTTIAQLKDAIGLTCVQYSDNIALQVKYAKLLKTALKEVNKLGGDYVNVLIG